MKIKLKQLIHFLKIVWADTDVVRLAISCDISRRPLILHDLQPPVLCRYLAIFFKLNESTCIVVQENIATLEVPVDHIQCHYNLSCDRLRSLLSKEINQIKRNKCHLLDQGIFPWKEAEILLLVQKKRVIYLSLLSKVD